MTQDVQPLTWQKRTNLEEHQQFFSKINEIIANLAPTVDEAEQAIAQATQAIASANQAIATANAASAAASAAAQQAQTAANTVAGYDTRLTTDEGNIAANAAGITALQGRMGTAEGKITAIEGREPGYLKKAGDPQTVTSQIMVPTTATGIMDMQIANGTRIQNDLASYEPMIRTTGNQDKAGNLSMLSRTDYPNRGLNFFSPPSYTPRGITQVMAGPNDDNIAMREEFTFASVGNTLAFVVHCGDEDGVTDHTATLMLTVFRDGKARLQLMRESGTVQIVPQG